MAWGGAEFHCVAGGDWPWLAVVTGRALTEDITAAMKERNINKHLWAKRRIGMIKLTEISSGEGTNNSNQSNTELQTVITEKKDWRGLRVDGLGESGCGRLS